MKYGFAKAILWIVSYLGLAMSPALLAYMGPVAARTFWVEVGVGLGFVALGVLVLEFVLSGRFKNVARSFGLDSMLHFHRHAGLVALMLVLAHPTVLFLADRDYLEYLDFRVDFLRALALSAVTLATLILVSTSLWRMTFRLKYEWWRLIHGALATFVVFIGVVHVLQVGHYVSEPWLQGFFVVLLAGSVGFVAHTRILRPWHMRRTPYRVTALRGERGDAWTLSMEPDGHEGMNFRPGQFAWITLKETPFSFQQNPYSFSSSAMDAPERLEFTVKVEGDFSSSVREVEPGRTAFLEGPYGYFLPDPDPAVGCVMIVGGVGVTPCMSMLRTFADQRDPRDIVMIYANVSLDETIFFDELQGLQERLRLSVIHVLEEPPEDWDGEEGLIDHELLGKHLPQNRSAYEYFICGPEPMMNIAERSLLDLGIPQRRILSERFNMV